MAGRVAPGDADAHGYPLSRAEFVALGEIANARRQVAVSMFAGTQLKFGGLLTCADTSTVANFFVADIGLPGWMDKVETMKRKQVDPMLKIATKNIEAARFQLDGLQANKGTRSKRRPIAPS